VLIRGSGLRESDYSISDTLFNRFETKATDELAKGIFGEIWRLWETEIYAPLDEADALISASKESPGNVTIIFRVVGIKGRREQAGKFYSRSGKIRIIAYQVCIEVGNTKKVATKIY
jgi:hypothetical protein